MLGYLNTLIFIVFLFNFMVVHPYIWGNHNKELYFGLIFGVSLLFLLVKNTRARFIGLLLVIILLYVGGLTSAIGNRYKSSTWAFVHDSVLQNEVAGRFLLLGRNPYVENYIGSGLENVPYDEGDGREENPALHHLASLPLPLLINAHPQILFAKIFGFYDGRYSYYLVLGLFIFIVAKFFKISTVRNLFFILFFLNPLTARFFIEGRSDFLISFLLFATVYALFQKHYRLAGIVYALAVVSKLTAWILIPFIAIYLYKNKDLKSFKQFFGPVLLISVLLIVPFLVWDFHAFVEDNFLYLGGGGTGNYPITGYGFSQILLNLGIIDSPYAKFPFWITQAIVGIPLLIYLMKRQIAANTLGNMVMSYGIFLFVIWYFSHHFNDSYFIFLTQIFTISFFVLLNERKSLTKTLLSKLKSD